ncbi:MAG: hypothetical protein LBJ90_04225 [Treponema sp.]|jgi:hypothetical protein|nr:hypothetical protein [Treponema sp.]
MSFPRGRKLILPILILALVFTGGYLFFRPPVLILTDIPFTALYGTQRARLRQLKASLALLRRVKPVIIADGTGPDMIVFAVEAASFRPYCVVFPARYAEGAKRYAERFPGVISVLLENSGAGIRGYGGSRAGEDPAEAGGLRVVRTDRRTDFFRAGLCAGIISGGQTGRIPLFLDKYAVFEDQEAFFKGLQEGGTENSPLFFTAPSSLDNFNDLTCAVFAGSGAEISEKSPKFPLILFSWLDPALTTRETLLVFDDSPWALVVPVVKTVRALPAAGEVSSSETEIPSKILIISDRFTDNGILRSVKEAVRSELRP